MSTHTKEAPAVLATEFSPQEIAALRERKEAVEAKWVATAREQFSEGEDGDKAVLTAEVSPEAQETIARLEAEWRTITASLKLQTEAKERADYIGAEEDLTRNAPKYRDRQAKMAVEFYRNLVAVGQNEYRNPAPDKAKGLAPGSLELKRPAIGRDPITGENKVYPFPAVFAGRGDDDDASIAASFRNAEMIAADAVGRYDPVTGKRLGVVQADQNLADYTQLTQGGMLHLYEIQMNELARYVDVKQTPYINNYLVDRRTTVPNAALVTEAGSIAVNDSDFDTVTITPRKLAMQKRMSYESGMTMEPWEMSNVLMRDGGIGIGNAVGELIVSGDGTTGTGMAQQWQGIDAFIKSAATYQHDPNLPNANFLPTAVGGTNNFGIREMSNFMGTLPKEYFRMAGKMLVMSLAVWTRLQGAEDGEQRKLFDSNSSIGDLQLPDFNVGVVLDENVDAGTATNEVPIYYGHLGSFCLVYFGPTRIDFSPYEAWSTDQLSWRFIAHRGFANIDVNGIRGFKVD